MPKRQIRQILESGDAAKMSRKIRELVKFWQVTAIADPHRIKRHENEQPPPPDPPTTRPVANGDGGVDDARLLQHLQLSPKKKQVTSNINCITVA